MQSEKLRIATIIGARPQFIKASAVSRAILRHNSSNNLQRPITEIIIHTGQHYDEKMSQLFFDELHIPSPDYNLGVGSGPHGVQTAAMLSGIEEILVKETPHLVLTYGDTNSTLAGALAAVKLHIPSAHVEAGLRSHNRTMPEEINRIVADNVSNILFCPTENAIKNLEKEGIIGNDSRQPAGFDFNVQLALNVGDVMYDSILFNEHLSQHKSGILTKLGLVAGTGFKGKSLPDKPEIKPYCLATVHRPGNTDNRENLTILIHVFTQISVHSPVVLPIHPRTRKRLLEYNLLTDNQSGNHSKINGIKIIDPVSYLDMIQLEKYAEVILTDSGGVQKEAFMLGTPCITLRDETEWIETILAGWNVLTGNDPEKIKRAYAILQKRQGGKPPFDLPTSFHQNREKNLRPYGDGNAAEKIVETICGLPIGLNS